MANPPVPDDTTVAGPSAPVDYSRRLPVANPNKGRWTAAEIIEDEENEAKIRGSTENARNSLPTLQRLSKTKEREIQSFHDPDICSYEIRPTGTALGDGMFATRDIPADAIILSEPCLLAVEEYKFVHSSEKDEHLVESLAGLSPTDQQYVKSLEPTSDIVNMFNAHSLWLQDAYMTRKMYREICKINHACVPNAVLYHKEAGVGEVRARLPISKDRQISIHYLAVGLTGDMVEDKYGFICGCATCEGGVERRGHISSTSSTDWEAIAQRASPLSNATDDSVPIGQENPPPPEVEEEEMAKELWRRFKARCQKGCIRLNVFRLFPRRVKKKPPFYQQARPPPSSGPVPDPETGPYSPI